MIRYRYTSPLLAAAAISLAVLGGCRGTTGSEESLAEDQVITMSRRDIASWDQTVQSLQPPTIEGLSSRLGLNFSTSSQTSTRVDLTSTERVELDNGVVIAQSLFAYLVAEPTRYLLSFELEPGSRCVSLDELREAHPGLQLTQAPSGQSTQEEYVYRDGSFVAAFKQVNGKCLASFGRATM